jgi:hypothetical protein
LLGALIAIQKLMEHPDGSQALSKNAPTRRARQLTAPFRRNRLYENDHALSRLCSSGLSPHCFTVFETKRAGLQHNSLKRLG